MENKYLGSTGLAKFLENLYNVFSPVGHSHTKSQITDFPTIPTDVSQLNNDSGYITAEDIPNLEISVDSMLSENSENPVQNKVIKYEIDNLTAQIEDASSKYLTVDMLNEDEAEPNTINADTLGGYAASEYIRKDQASVEVNYSVVGSPAAPATPTQNMIWIETSTPIGRVFFGNNEPNETFIEGDVWICTGDSSNVGFNALRIGGNYVNMIYPIYAKQYVDGAWVDVTAKTYQNCEWVDWITYFLDGENQYDGLTGGWTGNGTIETNGISLDSGNTASFDKYMHTANAIDFSLFNMLKIKVSRYYDYGDLVNTKWVKVTIRTAPKGGGTELAVAYIYGTGITEFNVENVNQSGYLSIQTGNTSHITVETIFA